MNQVDDHALTVAQIKYLIIDMLGLSPEQMDKIPLDHLDKIQIRVDQYADRGNDYGTSFLKAWDDYIASLEGKQ